jgi:hypothetical protein
MWEGGARRGAILPLRPRNGKRRSGVGIAALSPSTKAFCSEYTVFAALQVPLSSRPSITMERNNEYSQCLAWMLCWFRSTPSSAPTVGGCSYAAHWLCASQRCHMGCVSVAMCMGGVASSLPSPLWRAVDTQRQLVPSSLFGKSRVYPFGSAALGAVYHASSGGHRVSPTGSKALYIYSIASKRGLELVVC